MREELNIKIHRQSKQISQLHGSILNKPYEITIHWNDTQIYKENSGNASYITMKFSGNH